MFSLSVNVIGTPSSCGWWWYLIHQFLISIVWDTITSLAQWQPLHPTLLSQTAVLSLFLCMLPHQHWPLLCVSLYQIAVRGNVGRPNKSMVSPSEEEAFVFFLNLSLRVVPQPSWLTKLVMQTYVEENGGAFHWLSLQSNTHRGLIHV